MRTTTTTLSLSFALSLSLALGGCGGQVDPADDATGATAQALLEQPEGGFTSADEAPDFGDPNVAGAPAMSDAVGVDQLLDAAGEPRGLAAPAGARHVFRVMILWGHLPRPRDGAPATPPAAPATATDWSGSVGVDAGIVSVRRTLGFEDRDRVAPRAAPATVSFTSRTQPFVDGLVLAVRTADAAPVLRFRTAAINLDLPMPDADGAVRRVGDGDNGVYYAAYEERPACNQGFVFGHWARMRANLGVFRGHAVDATGARAGAVRGIWGRRRDGQQVFFGKHVTTAGRFDGLLGGTWGDGAFQGHWGTRDGSRGALRGRYFDGVERADGRGVFLGRWQERCQ